MLANYKGDKHELIKNSLKRYKKLLKEIKLQVAYRELIAFITKFQMYFKSNDPEYDIVKCSYQGYLDLLFFTFTTEELKSKQLKIAVVFLHKAIRFEAWLSGINRNIMTIYNKKLKVYNLGEYLLANDEKGMDSKPYLRI